MAGYFYRNRCHMQYDDYLRQGWPIATGAVEGAYDSKVTGFPWSGVTIFYSPDALRDT